MLTAKRLKQFKDEGSFGSMLELSWKGTRTVTVGDQTRKFINDYDEVTLRGMLPAYYLLFLIGSV